CVAPGAMGSRWPPSRVPFIVVELGVDADPFMLHLYAALAEKERPGDPLNRPTHWLEWSDRHEPGACAGRKLNPYAFWQGKVFVGVRLLRGPALQHGGDNAG